MTASSTLSVRQSRILEALRPILGSETEALYEVHGRSLQRLAGFARESALPGCRRLVASIELAQELLIEELTQTPVFNAPAAVSDYLKLHFAGQAHESFAILFLNARHGLVAFEDVFRGTLTQTSVYPREVLKRALHHNAAAVILAHNHPSGGADPSAADEMLTRTLKSALAMIDVKVLDHLVVAGHQTTSLAERGLI